MINTRCSSSVADVSAVSDEVYRAIGDVVMSMQAHDIVRQQIEHVDEALTDLRHGLSTGTAGADDRGRGLRTADSPVAPRRCGTRRCGAAPSATA